LSVWAIPVAATAAVDKVLHIRVHAVQEFAHLYDAARVSTSDLRHMSVNAAWSRTAPDLSASACNSSAASFKGVCDVRPVEYDSAAVKPGTWRSICSSEERRPLIGMLARVMKVTLTDGRSQKRDGSLVVFSSTVKGLEHSSPSLNGVFLGGWVIQNNTVCAAGSTVPSNLCELLWGRGSMLMVECGLDRQWGAPDDGTIALPVDELSHAWNEGQA
ncbi:hypothetical protein KCU92_g299, partial [Aureobasidium melanogenum]